MKNNYVFLGSPEFAAEVLKKLISLNIEPFLIITNPDRPQGREQKITPPEAKIVAEQNNIPFWQPENLDAAELKSKIGEATFGVVAAYSKILPKKIIEAFPMGIIGIHPSLLPKYRGASPIQSALLSGEKETGVSLYLMDEKMDHGPVLSQKKTAISDSDDYVSLETKLAQAGAELFAETIPRFLSQAAAPLPQEESTATFTKKFRTEDAFLKPEEIMAAKSGDAAAVRKIFNSVRAFSREPVAWTYGSALPELQINPEKRVRIFSAGIESGKLKINRIQVEGKLPRKI